MDSKRKKSGHPTRPGNRSTASRPIKRKRKGGTILSHFWRNFKENIAVNLFLVLVAAFAVYCLVVCATTLDRTGAKEPVAVLATTSTETPADVAEEYIFRDGDGYPIDWQALTDAWAAESGFEGKRYNLTDAERWEVASVVTAEAEGEPLAGKVAVAQCILQACEDDGLRPSEVLVKYQYAKSRPEPTAEALEAVQNVFDFGHTATAEPIKYFYNPDRCQSDFHESQVYIMTINGHKFFKEAEG